MNISTGGPHILLFERDKQLATLLTSELQLAGYTCHTARTAVEVFDGIARLSIRLVLVDLAQAASARREFWVALDTQRRDRKVQVLTFLCTNIAGYGTRELEDRPQNTMADMEIDGMLGLMSLVDAVRTRVPGMTIESAHTQPRVPRVDNPTSQNSIPPISSMANTRGENTYNSMAASNVSSYSSGVRTTNNVSPQVTSRPLQPISNQYEAQMSANGITGPDQQTYSEKIRSVLYPNQANQQQNTWSTQRNNNTTNQQDNKDGHSYMGEQQGGFAASQGGTNTLNGTHSNYPSNDSALQRLANGQTEGTESGLAQLSKMLKGFQTPAQAPKQGFTAPVQEEVHKNTYTPQAETQVNNYNWSQTMSNLRPALPNENNTPTGSNHSYPQTQNINNNPVATPWQQQPAASQNMINSAPQAHTPYQQPVPTGQAQGITAQEIADIQQQILRIRQQGLSDAQSNAQLINSLPITPEIRQNQTRGEQTEIFAPLAEPKQTIGPIAISNLSSPYMPNTPAPTSSIVQERTTIIKENDTLPGMFEPMPTQYASTQEYTQSQPLRASPIQDITIERTGSGPAVPDGPKRPDVLSRVNYGQQQTTQNKKNLSTGTPLASIATPMPPTTTQNKTTTTPSAPKQDDAQKITSQSTEKRESKIKEERYTPPVEQAPKTEQQLHNIPEELHEGLSAHNAVLLDIVQSLPPMSELPPQQEQSIQPQVLNGRATRSLNKVLLDGHLVPQDRLEVAQNIQRMLRGVDLNYQMGEILLMFKLLTPDQLLAASLVSYGLINTTQISSLGHIRQELHSIGLEYDLENLLVLFRILTPEQLREVRASLQG